MTAIFIEKVLAERHLAAVLQTIAGGPYVSGNKTAVGGVLFPDRTRGLAVTGMLPLGRVRADTGSMRSPPRDDRPGGGCAL